MKAGHLDGGYNYAADFGPSRKRTKRWKRFTADRYGFSNQGFHVFLVDELEQGEAARDRE